MTSTAWRLNSSGQGLYRSCACAGPPPRAPPGSAGRTPPAPRRTTSSCRRARARQSGRSSSSTHLILSSTSARDVEQRLPRLHDVQVVVGNSTPNTLSTWSSISRCCPVAHTTVSNSLRLRLQLPFTSGHILIASGRVPKTSITFLISYLPRTRFTAATPFGPTMRMRPFLSRVPPVAQEPSKWWIACEFSVRRISLVSQSFGQNQSLG